MEVKYDGKPLSVRKMTEEDKLKMDAWAKRANEDRMYKTQTAAINRRVCARKHYQSKDISAL